MDSKDLQRSSEWAIAGLGSIGSVINWYPFDLVNRVSGRAHRLHAVVAGMSATPIPTASAAPPDYTNFRTTAMVRFSDFDGVGARVTSVNAGVLFGYGLTILTLWTDAAYQSPLLAQVKMTGVAIMLPGAVFGNGIATISYGVGSPVGLASMLLPFEDPPIAPRIVKWTNVPKMPKRIIAPSEVLFDFDRYALKPTAIAALTEIEALLNMRTTANVRICGYTDAEGTDAYNQALSIRRASAVRDWLVNAKVFGAKNFQISGFGKTHPVAPNRISGKDNPEGRTLNRRVEIVYD
ncbi:OmpA family protein [Variovorax sp. dw_308]|uniref:OmpA family protein n=1 Tax=Variovorax sp. dw_308 TaxID=2721546 RepID=UPI001C454DAB|nr:OmpA family protein [Variovorax sp. dw_308]